MRLPWFDFVTLNKALLGPYFLAGVALGGAARIPLKTKSGLKALRCFWSVMSCSSNPEA